METTTGRWYRVLREPWGAVLGICIVWLGLQASALGPLTPILITQLGGLDKTQVVLFFVINILIGIAVNLATGYLSDGKVPRPVLILVAGVVSSVGNAGLAVGGSAGMLYFFGALTSTGLVLFSQFFAVAQAQVMKLWSKEDKVLGTTVLRTGFSLGFIVGTGLASALLLWIDLRSLFWGLSVTGVLLAVFSTVVVLRIEVWGRSLGSVAFQLFHDAHWAPLMFGTTAAVELVSMILVGSLAVRFGERRTIVVGALLGAACFVVMAVFPSLAVMFLANVAYAFFIAMLMGVAMAYIQGMLAHRPGLGGSLYVLTMNVGALIGTFAPVVVTGYSPATFFLPAGLCVLGAVLMVGRGEPVRHSRR